MKKYFLFFVILGLFCSCANRYPQLVKERVEKYKSEGKTILSQSNDETGKEHFIVFVDSKENAIGVDTLGEKVKYIKLGEKEHYEYTLKYEYDTDGLSICELARSQNSGNPLHVSWTFDGKFHTAMYDNGVQEWKCYKDKYILLKNNRSDYWVLFLNNPKAYYQINGTVKMAKNGNLEVTLSEMPSLAFFPSNGYDFDPSYLKEEDILRLSLTNMYSSLNLELTISPDGKVLKKADDTYLTIGGSLPKDENKRFVIPLDAYYNWSTLLSYLIDAMDYADPMERLRVP